MYYVLTLSTAVNLTEVVRFCGLSGLMVEHSLAILKAAGSTLGWSSLIALLLPPSLQLSLSLSLPPSVDSIRGFARMLRVLQQLGDAYGF